VKRENLSGHIGTAHPRIEGPEKVTGRAQYSSDVRLPGQLVARVLRSPHAHARLRRLDTSAASRLPGVHAVLSREDAPDMEWYEGGRLFGEELQFVGDEVAAVAAETEDIAEDALRLIEVEYERLAFQCSFPAGTKGRRQVEGRGDVEAGLREAEVLIEDVFTTPSALHNCMEPHGCVACWEEGDGGEGARLVLYESTQGVHSVRSDVAEKLGLAEENVRVVTQHMGGGFGSKQIAWKHSVIAALLARKAGRPVQLMLDRKEENLAAGNRNATRQRLRIGAKRDGTLTAIDVRVELDAGAYTAGGEESDVIGTYQTLYRCPNVRAEQVSIHTNLGPAIAFRAPGYAEATFALESAMDRLARELKMDPVELRLKNYAETDQKKGKPYTSVDSLKRCYEVVQQAFPSLGKKSVEGPGTKRRGVGFAAHDWVAGAGHPPAQARVELHEDGTATVVTGTQDIGTGTRTALAQIAAEELGISLSKIQVKLGDTDQNLLSPTSAGSSTLPSMGPAVREAAASARSRTGGRGERGPNTKTKSIRTCGAQGVEVEVDTQTGEVTVLRVVTAHDCGRVINPMLVDSQVYGGVTQGLGFALTEERIVDARMGEVLNANLEEYLVPTAADLPDIHNATLSMPDAEANSTGAKGIGEPPLIATAAAVANAIYDAIGVRIHDLPITRAKILAAL
jgi:xanthine dehydrogenase YagR molybdenum-binding subunit